MSPSLIEWRDEFRIGLPEVDEEHRSLIEEINRLHQELVVGAAIVRVTGAIGDIHSAIAAHFALEEKEMTALGYDGLVAHKTDHERLLDELLDMLDEVVAAGTYDPAACQGGCRPGSSSTSAHMTRGCIIGWRGSRHRPVSCCCRGRSRRIGLS